MVKITGKNGKPLYGAAIEAVLRKLNAEFWQRQEEQKIMLLGLSDRLNKLERAAKDILLLLVAALAIGCAARTLLKPELAAVGGSAAGLAVSIGRQ